jgi:type I restriction enzyme S subunit
MTKAQQNEWEETKLGKIVVFNYGKSLPEIKRVYGNIPVYSSAGLTGWHNEPLVNKKGIVVGRKGTIGSVHKSERPFFAIDTVFYISEDDADCDFNFLFYMLSNLGLDDLNSDSAVPGLNRNTAYDQDILLPPLPEQKAIAEVLSSLDDKIDLLHRQNKTLEDMAQALFRKWFIEEAKEDWEEKPLDEIADYLNGLACQKYPPENEIDKLPVLKIKELRNGFTENSDWATSKVDEKYIIELGDVIFSWSGSLMLKIWDGQKCILNQHLFKVTSEKYPKWFYYFWTKHHLEKFIGIANSKATTMGHIKRGDLSNSLVMVPNTEELLKMSERISLEFEKIILNCKQIANLEQQRDTLLPKLMTGAVRVKLN